MDLMLLIGRSLSLMAAFLYKKVYPATEDDQLR